MSKTISKTMKKHVRKWVRRAGIWLYLKYATGKQHIDRIREERSHDVVQIHSAYVRLYSNTEKKITSSMDMTQNFRANWKRRGMYMRSPHCETVDGVFMKWRPDMTLTEQMNRFPTTSFLQNQDSLWLKVEYSFIKKEEEADRYAALYMIHPPPPRHQQKLYYYFPPYSISTIDPSGGGSSYWLGPAIPSNCGISTFHRWPEPWMQAETILMQDQQKKTS